MPEPEPTRPQLSRPMPLSDTTGPALPGWARTEGEEAGGGWLAAARRWLRPAGADTGADTGTDPEAAAGLPLSPLPPSAATAAGPASTRTAPTGDASALVERLRRSVAHALRHPGYGFALLVLVLQAPAGSGRLREVWRQAERRLQLTLRPGDALFLHDTPARGPGGAAFALVLDGIGSAADLVAVVDRLRAEFAEPFLAGREPMRLRSRLAVVHGAPGLPPQPAESLLARAEAVLSTLGEDGVGGLDPAAKPSAALALGAEDLRTALEANELVLEYQPQVALAGGGVTALELVWRWQHRRRGALAPEAVGAALGVAEAAGDTQLADRLLRLALERAAADRPRLDGAGDGEAAPRLALPLTLAQAARADTADRLGESLAAAGLQAHQVQLELPSLPDLADRNRLERLRALAAQGFALALDGVGDGLRAPSLATLAAAPLALWRLAPALLASAGGGGHRRVLLDGILNLARAQGVATLATGLDTPEPLALARRLGCTQGQGAALAAPMPASALPRWLAQHRVA